MKRILLTAALVLSLAACTDQSGAREALLDAGYTEIQLHGYAWFSCDDKDRFATSFTAKGPSGRTVTGAVCSGFFKGNTIRLD